MDREDYSILWEKRIKPTIYWSRFWVYELGKEGFKRRDDLTIETIQFLRKSNVQILFIDLVYGVFECSLR